MHLQHESAEVLAAALYVRREALFEEIHEHCFAGSRLTAMKVHALRHAVLRSAPVSRRYRRGKQRSLSRSAS